MLEWLRNLLNMWKLTKAEEEIILQWRFEKDSFLSHNARVIRDELDNEQVLLIAGAHRESFELIRIKDWRDMNDWVEKYSTPKCMHVSYSKIAEKDGVIYAECVTCGELHKKTIIKKGE